MAVVPEGVVGEGLCEDLVRNLNGMKKQAVQRPGGAEGTVL